jgi:hypothetical protein
MGMLLMTLVRVRAARDRLQEEGGFQTAEAIGIAAVGLLVLFAIWGALSVLGVDVIGWIRDTFGIGGDPMPPPGG